MMAHTKIHLSESEIDEIIEEMDCGFRCFLNLRTQELKYVMDSNDPLDWADDMEEDLAEIEKNPDDYFEFNKIDSQQSFFIMEGFAEKVKDLKLRERLIDALNRPKPFRNFKNEIDDSGEYRQEWFDYKRNMMMDMIKDQIDRFNSTQEGV